MDNRREEPRLEDRATIRYRDIDCGAVGGYRFQGAVSGNLSAGGILLLTPARHEEGARLELELLLPAQPGAPVHRNVLVRGRVTRCSKVPDATQRFTVGIEIEECDDVDRDRLHAYLDALCRVDD